MPTLKQLTPDQLQGLHQKAIEMRQEVLDFVEKYEYQASALMSKTFLHDIEKEYGRKILKERSKNMEKLKID